VGSLDARTRARQDEAEMDNSSPTGRPAPHRAAWTGLLIGLALTAAVVLRLLAPFLSVIVLGLVAAGLLASWHRQLAKALGGRRHLAAIVICLLLVVALLLPLFLIGREVSTEALSFYEMSKTQLTRGTLLESMKENPEQLNRLNRMLAPFRISLTPDELYDRLTSFGVRAGAFFYKQGVSLAKGLLRFVVGFLVWVVVVYFLLVDGDTLRRWFHETIPLPADEQDTLSGRFIDMAASLVIGNGVASTIQALIGAGLFAILGLPGPALWGVVMWILAFIPVIGISLVYIPAWFVLLLAGETGRAFGVLIPLMLVATVVEYWLKPVLVGRRAQLHPLLVFMSLLGGFEAFGAVGIFLGPLMMTAFLTLVGIYQEHYRPFLPPPRRTRRVTQKAQQPGS
jgi:predicted PurR-regulated permease PerM